MKLCERGNAVQVTSVSEQSITTVQNKSSDKSTLKKGLLRMFGANKLKTLVPILVLGICALLILKSLPTSTKVSSASGSEDGVSYTSSLEYIAILEDKLNKVLSGINGAGKTQVMITIDSSPILTIAKNEETKTVSSSGGSTTTTTSEPIYVTANGKSNPLIIGETLPEIKGVIVVSSGASDVRVKMDIINAVRTALGISSDIIEVFVGG